MKKILKIVGYGFLTRLIPFAISFVVFPLRASQRPFFETIMAVVVAATAVLFSALYLRRVQVGWLKEGALIGGVWFAVNIVIDLLLFLPPSPMQMVFADYMMDIGLTYLIYPIVAMGCGYLLEQKASARG